MKDAYRQVLNLIHHFADHFDRGEFEKAASLFDEGEFLLSEDRKATGREMLAMWGEILILYDGSPRTRHTVTNHIVEIDAIVGRATCASAYTVLQQVPGGSLNTVLTGRYFDSFRRRDKIWKFYRRDYRHVEFVGDVSRHLKPDVAKRLHTQSNIVSLPPAGSS